MAQHEPIIRHINPATLPTSSGYTQVVTATGGTTVYISGQVALAPDGALVGADDLDAQAVQVFENLRAALAAVGATFEHVVKLTIFVLDASRAPIVRAVRDRYINTQAPPASTAVEVRRLFREDFLIEVEAVAVVP
ncbi:MAG TPA: RidA family protein [Ktedonobacterales bacterium]|jgi:enamine deaminase RidA (YjgF/YER057c/UK114 family)